MRPILSALPNAGSAFRAKKHPAIHTRFGRGNGIICTGKKLSNVFLDDIGDNNFTSSPTQPLNIKKDDWRVAADFVARKDNLEVHIPAIERLFSEGKPVQLIPIRFTFSNKLTKKDKLTLAFDSLVLSEAFRSEIVHGKIFYGDGFSRSRVKIKPLIREVQKLNDKIGHLLSTKSPPEIILKRHCQECDYQAKCRQTVIEKDDLSLLASMNEKERTKYNSKGIFTVTQLSYTFRPRRRPKRLRDKREKYHHSLKALAIREKKIHIVGTPELKINGTPIYIDVEGVPDRDFYYLIGMLIKDNNSVVQRSLWADTLENEADIWQQFLAVVSAIENPVIYHYGSFEATFLKKMCERYGGPSEGTALGKAIKEPVNVLETIYAQIYFPGFSNSLKDCASFLGFKWSDEDCFGLNSIAIRHLWEVSHDITLKEKLLRYNDEDCQALELLSQTIRKICSSGVEESIDQNCKPEFIRLDSNKFNTRGKWKSFNSPVPTLEIINAAAHWDYQRERVYVRTGAVKKEHKMRRPQQHTDLRPEKVIIWDSAPICPYCNRSYYRREIDKSKKLYEIIFGHRNIKLRLVKYVFPMRLCRKCGAIFGMPDRYKFIKKYGWNLIAYFFYHVVDSGIPQRKIVRGFNRLFNFQLNRSTLHNIKIRVATYYTRAKQQILEKIIQGSLLHIDETRANIKGQSAFVWVLTSHKEVVYILAESREGDIAHKLLADFKGVLVSDFYTAYDSIDCPQQKCLIHLMRDLNDEILNNPFDEQLKQIVTDFGDLLKPMIETVDRYGLKKYFLKKHIIHAERFYRSLERTDYQSEAAVKCKERFEKNRDKLFTFLKYDGVPWNNNNAEHAIKAFARLRDVIGGSSTEKGIDEYLTLLSICQTCKYRGVDFLDFLKSGEKSL